MFCYAYCSQSQQNLFKIFLIIDGFYSLIFPTKSEEITHFLTINYAQITSIIDSNTKAMFLQYDSFKEDQSRINAMPLNQIFKKILLEVNQLSISLKKKNTHCELRQCNRIVIISDCNVEDELDYEQKFLYLMKKGNVYIDCIHLGEFRKEYNNKLESIAFYSGGIFENVRLISDGSSDEIMMGVGENEERLNLGQVLLQQFLLFPEDRKVKYCNNSIMNEGGSNINNNKHNNTINTNNTQMLNCENCHKSDISLIFYPKNNILLCTNCLLFHESKLKSS